MVNVAFIFHTAHLVDRTKGNIRDPAVLDPTVFRRFSFIFPLLPWVPQFRPYRADMRKERLSGHLSHPLVDSPKHLDIIVQKQ